MAEEEADGVPLEEAEKVTEAVDVTDEVRLEDGEGLTVKLALAAPLPLPVAGGDRESVPDAVPRAGADGEMLLEAEPESDKDKDGDAVTLLLVVREPLAETGAKGTRAYTLLSCDPT